MITKPEFITFTGVDDNTDYDELVALNDDYPDRIEWGFLFSPKRQGIEPRYPAIRTIERMTDVRMRFSAHFCGGDARTVIEDGFSRHEHLLARFERAQINTADPNVQPTLIRRWADNRGLVPILQCRGPFPPITACEVLFDASGGRGISPPDWPTGLNVRCGYAGGLNPCNVAAAVDVIGTRATKYWIDMESGVRDEYDQLSLAKCREVCEAVYGVPRGNRGQQP